MSAVLKFTGPSIVTREVKGEFGDFTISLRTPTAADRIKDLACRMSADFEQMWLARLACIQGWSGIQDESGKQVPFSALLLDAAMADQRIQNAVFPVLQALFLETPDEQIVRREQEKNSPAPPS